MQRLTLSYMSWDTVNVAARMTSYAQPNTHDVYRIHIYHIFMYVCIHRDTATECIFDVPYLSSWWLHNRIWLTRNNGLMLVWSSHNIMNVWRQNNGEPPDTCWRILSTWYVPILIFNVLWAFCCSWFVMIIIAMALVGGTLRNPK